MDHLLSIVHIVGWHQCRRMTGTWMGLASLNQWIKSIHTWQRSLRKGYKCGVCVALVQNVAADCCRCLAISLQCYCDSDGWGWWGGWIKGGRRRRRRRRRGRRRRRQQCDDSGMISFIQIHKSIIGLSTYHRGSSVVGIFVCLLEALKSKVTWTDYCKQRTLNSVYPNTQGGQSQQLYIF